MTLSLALAFVLAAFIGLALGLLGSGGSIITLPVLVHVAGIPVSQAVPLSLAIVGGTSLIGAGLQYRQGFLDLRAALLFSVAGAVGASGGARLTHRFPPAALMFLFAVLMLAAGILMLRPAAEKPAGGPGHPARCLAAGLGVGALTGFLGVGGGFLIVAALVLFGGLETRRAMGTALAIIAVNSVAGLVGHWRLGALDPGLALGFTAAATVGMVAGVAGAGRLSPARLRRAFAWFILVLAVVLLVRYGVELRQGTGA